jgi:formylmethanofuran dehydrogenase subunit E
VKTLRLDGFYQKQIPLIYAKQDVLFSLLDFSHIYDCVVGVGSAICEKCYHEGDHHKHEFGNSKSLCFSCLESHYSSKFIIVH